MELVILGLIVLSIYLFIRLLVNVGSWMSAARAPKRRIPDSETSVTVARSPCHASVTALQAAPRSTSPAPISVPTGVSWESVRRGTALLRPNRP